MTVFVKLTDTVTLAVNGDYTREEANVGLPESFKIRSVSQNTGTLLDLLDWVADQGLYYTTALEELILEEINTNNYDNRS